MEAARFRRPRISSRRPSRPFAPPPTENSSPAATATTRPFADVVSHGFSPATPRRFFLARDAREGRRRARGSEGPPPERPVPADPARRTRRASSPPPLTVDQRDARLESERNWSATCASTPGDVASTDRAVTRARRVRSRRRRVRAAAGRRRPRRRARRRDPLATRHDSFSRLVASTPSVRSRTPPSRNWVCCARVHNGVVTAPWATSSSTVSNSSCAIARAASAAAGLVDQRENSSPTSQPRSATTRRANVSAPRVTRRGVHLAT